jgi:ammonium transporter, Amt family
MNASVLSPLETSYIINTLYLLFCGVLVMFMAAGFAMLEGGLVRAKNTAEIMTKNIVLYALAGVMYLFIGYDLMFNQCRARRIFLLSSRLRRHSNVSCLWGGGRADETLGIYFICSGDDRLHLSC